MECKVYLTNLGKYNEGALVGKWVDIMGGLSEDEWKEELKKIGVDGKEYEEYFITDYDTDIPGVYEYFGEYPSLKKLSQAGEAFEQIENDHDDEIMMACLELGVVDIDDIIENGSNAFQDCYLIPGISDYDDLGRHEVEENYENITEIRNYDDYIDITDYAKDIADDWVYEEDEEEYDLSFFEEMVENDLQQGLLTEDELENYFDFEAFGRNIDMENSGGFTEYGYLFCY